MSISVACPSCRTRMRAPDTAAGKKVRCPKCQEIVPLVAAQDSPPKPEEEAPEPAQGEAPPAQSTSIDEPARRKQRRRRRAEASYGKRMRWLLGFLTVGLLAVIVGVGFLVRGWFGGARGDKADRIVYKERTTLEWLELVRRHAGRPHPVIREQIEDAAKNIPPDPQATAELLEALTESGSHHFAEQVLNRFGPDQCRQAAAVLVNAVDDPKLQQTALILLHKAGTEARPALSTVKRLALQGDPFAVETLGVMGPEAVTPLLTLLKRPDARFRRAVLGALAELGPSAAEAVPGLQEVLRDRATDWDTRQLTWQVLSKIGPAAVPVLVASVNDADEKTAAQAALALGRMGPAALAAVPQLRQALPDPRLTPACAQALGAIGRDARDALPDLLAVLRDAGKYPTALGEVTEAVVKLLPGSSVSVADLVWLLEQSGTPLRWVVGKGSDGYEVNTPASPTALTLRFVVVKELGEHGAAARSAVASLKRVQAEAAAQAADLVKAADVEAMTRVTVSRGKVLSDNPAGPGMRQRTLLKETMPGASAAGNVDQQSKAQRIREEAEQQRQLAELIKETLKRIG